MLAYIAEGKRGRYRLSNQTVGGLHLLCERLASGKPLSYTSIYGAEKLPPN